MMATGSRTGRTVLHATFACLFALAAFAFAARMRDAWEGGDRARGALGALATLGAASLSVRAVRKARYGTGAAG